MSDFTPRNVTHVVERAVNAVHFAEKQSRRNRHGKRYDHDTYVRLRREREERERVTGNSEKGIPL